MREEIPTTAGTRHIALPRMKGTSLLFLLGGLAVHGPSELLALQEREIQITGPSPCEVSCGLSSEHIARLGSLDDPVSLTRATKVVRGSDGRFYAAPLAGAGRIAVYDSTGAFERVIGSPGEGPAELRRITRLAIDAADTLLVVQGPRLTRMYGPSGEVAGSAILTVQPRDFTLTPAGLPIAQYWPFGQSETLPRFHILDRTTGDPRRVFGRGIPPSGRYPYRSVQKIAAISEERVWAADVHQYVLTLWNVRDSSELRVRRQVPWFDAWTGEILPEDHLNPRTIALHGEGGSQVWVAVAVPDPAFRPPPVRQGEEASLEAFEPWAAWDTYVEVLDVQEGEVLGFRRFPSFGSTFINSDDGLFLVTLNSTELGLVVADVWRLRLTS